MRNSEGMKPFNYKKLFIGSVLFFSLSLVSYIALASPFDATARSMDTGIDWLKKHQTSEGHWGFIFYTSDEFGNVYNYTVQDVGDTSLSILALASSGEHNSPNFKKAVQWLKDQQHDDGGWGLNKDLDSHVAYTSLATIALIASGEDQNSQMIQKGVKWLQDNRNIFSEDENWGVYVYTEYPGEEINLDVSILLTGDYGQSETNIIKATKYWRERYDFIVPKGTKSIDVIVRVNNSRVGATLVNSDEISIRSVEGSRTLNTSYEADGLWGTKKLTRYSQVETMYAIMALKAVKVNIDTEKDKAVARGRDNVYTAAQGTFLKDVESLNMIKEAQNIDGAWGVTKDSKSNIGSTAKAVEALVAGEPNSPKIESGVEYLINNQNQDGGWGVEKEYMSTALSTSHALLALSSHKNNEAIFEKVIEGRK